MGTMGNLALQVMIVLAAVAYGIFSGRAKAERLRQLHADLKDGKMRGYAVIGTVALFVAFCLVAYRNQAIS